MFLIISIALVISTSLMVICATITMKVVILVKNLIAAIYYLDLELIDHIHVDKRTHVYCESPIISSQFVETDRNFGGTFASSD